MGSAVALNSSEAAVRECVITQKVEQSDPANRADQNVLVFFFFFMLKATVYHTHWVAR